MDMPLIRCAMRAVANSSEDFDNIRMSCISAPCLCKYATLGSTHHLLCKVSAIVSAVVNVNMDFFGSDILVVKPQCEPKNYPPSQGGGFWSQGFQDGEPQENN